MENLHSVSRMSSQSHMDVMKKLHLHIGSEINLALEKLRRKDALCKWIYPLHKI